ncbi:MAG: zinc ribbon domain-containing protein [Planctomycetota bacterium]
MSSGSSVTHCPSCHAPVEPGMPACKECGERLFVEHPGQFPRDSNAVEKDAFRKETDGE